MADELVEAQPATPSNLPQNHHEALGALLARVPPEVVWAVTGSTSFALQGLAVPVNDIDIQTDAAGVYHIATCFPAQLLRPVTFSAAERIRSHFGALQLAGVTVELMGDVQKRLPDGRWEEPVDVRVHRHFVEVAGLRVPVLDLAYEERAYRLLGRVATADLLRRHLAALDPGPNREAPSG